MPNLVSYFILLSLGLFSSSIVAQSDECRSLEDLVCGTTEYGEFSTFCNLMFTEFPQKGLDLKLDGGTWTVFLPTDGAFEAYAEVLAPILEDHSNMFWESDLEALNLVAYHFHNGDAIRVDDLECKGKLTMSNGEGTRHRCAGGETYQKGLGNHGDHGLPFPMMLDTDIEFCNGIIHVLDGVMLPKNYDDFDFEATDEEGIPIVVEYEPPSEDEPDAVSNDESGGAASPSSPTSAVECVAPESVYAVVNRFKIRSDQNCVDDWRAASNNNALGARTSETGALRFDILGITENEYILYELYTEEVAYFEGHLFTSHFKDWFSVRQRCVLTEEAVFPKGYIANTYDADSFFSPFCLPNSVNIAK